jgi:SAM-dependent methyltransferase
LEDWLTKEEAAQGIYDDFAKRAGNPVGASVLDIGFGNGITASVFARQGARMSGVEVSAELFSIATDYLKEKGTPADLRLYEGIVFPFADRTFDYIYSVSTLEHVSDAATVIKEACRVLKPGGKFYLAFPNRLNPRETHTGLWFLSYMPRTVAGLLLGFFGRNSIPDWNLHFLSYFWLRRLLQNNGIGFSILFEREGSGVRKILKKILAVFGIHHSAILPHVMVVLKKVDSSRHTMLV